MVFKYLNRPIEKERERERIEFQAARFTFRHADAEFLAPVNHRDNRAGQWDDSSAQSFRCTVFKKAFTDKFRPPSESGWNFLSQLCKCV